MEQDQHYILSDILELCRKARLVAHDQDQYVVMTHDHTVYVFGSLIVFDRHAKPNQGKRPLTIVAKHPDFVSAFGSWMFYVATELATSPAENEGIEQDDLLSKFNLS